MFVLSRTYRDALDILGVHGIGESRSTGTLSVSGVGRVRSGRVVMDEYMMIIINRSGVVPLREGTGMKSPQSVV